MKTTSVLVRILIVRKLEVRTVNSLHCHSFEGMAAAGLRGCSSMQAELSIVIFTSASYETTFPSFDPPARVVDS